MTKPCAQCPWRPENVGKPSPWGFYTKRNRTRLWNQVRGGGPQSCHPTDPRHPDHVAAGAKPGSAPVECAGSVILIIRELRALQAIAGDGVPINGEHVDHYLKSRPRGITKQGLIYWMVARAAGFARGTPMGEPPLPDVDESVEVCHS